MISFEPDVILTIAWCVFGIVMNILPIELGAFREISLVLLIIFTRKKMKFKYMHFFCIIFCIYYFTVSVFHEGIINSIRSSVSMISWIITLMFFSSYSKKKSDIKLIFNIIIIASLVVSIIFLLNNNLFSNSIEIYLNNGKIINRNTFIYYSFPGYLLLLIKIVKSNNNKILDYICLLILFFACIQINSRTMYLSIIICSFLILNKQIFSLVKRGKVFGMLIFLLVIIFLGYYIFNVLPEEYVSREFGSGTISRDAGRLDLWKEAFSMVKNPLFGMGPSFYEKNTTYIFADYGAHNILVDLYVSAGIFASILFVIIVSYFVKKNLFILAIVAPAFITFFVEAGRIFFPYMLLIISWFIIEGAKAEGQTIDSYLSDCFNDKTQNEL